MNIGRAINNALCDLADWWYDLHPRVRRTVVALTAPIWMTVTAVLLVLYMALMVGAFPFYWVWTGKSILKEHSFFN